MRHFVTATLIGLLFGAILAFYFFTTDLTPLKASWEAEELDVLMRTYLSIAGLIFGLVVAFLAYSVVVFRRRRTDDRGANFRFHPLVERGWIIVTLLLVLASAADAIVVLDKIFAPRVGYAESELEVNITSMQWAWRFEYPEYAIESTELVLEQNRPVLFKLRSNDVIHSFFVPEFRMKFDALPGTETQMRVVPTTTGTFRAVCAELCGIAHTNMVAQVRVLSPQDFQQWLADQREK